MTDKQSKIFAPSKVDIDHQKMEAYLNGERIFPTTIEMDLTQLCTRSCSGCPYGVSRRAGLTLQLPFLDRLFSILGPHTPGIVLSGGEATIVPHFPQTVALGKKKRVQGNRRYLQWRVHPSPPSTRCPLGACHFNSYFPLRLAGK